MDDAEDFFDQYCQMMMSSVEEDQQFLRNILQQPRCDHNHLSSPQSETRNKFSPTIDLSSDGSGDRVLSDQNQVMSPEARILSLDHSNVIPASAMSKQEQSSASEPRSLKRKKSRSGSETVNHIMKERRRRQELTERFIALSATIPELKKMDKVTILHEATKYVKRLQERVTELEKQNNINTEESVTVSKKCELHANEDLYKPNEVLPEITARVSENQVLFGIYCEKQKGIESKLLALLQNFHLYATSSSVLPLGNSTLGITIVAQMGDEYRMAINDVMEAVRQILS